MRDIYNAVLELTESAWHAPDPIRALTVTALYLTDSDASFEQLDLLGDKAQVKNEKQEKLESAMDAIRDKYGKSSIFLGNGGKFSGWDD